MTEQQWIARARHGDADAFEQLVVAYEGPVYRLALRMCGSTEDAREVTQDAFLAAWRGLPAFRGDSRFSSWLYRLTTNAAIDFLRREKHHLGNLPLEEAPERPDPQQPELLAEQREQQEALQRALDQLSSEHRQVLLLRVVQQLSYDEIAQALSLESGTVKSRISRARRQLREILLRQGNFFPDSAVLPNGKEGCVCTAIRNRSRPCWTGSWSARNKTPYSPICGIVPAAAATTGSCWPWSRPCGPIPIPSWMTCFRIS